MINFSFIIPHKNTPDLLQKCLDSIPCREDVQIIVVDDNSDSDKVDFEHFPGLQDNSVEVYLTKEGRGAGYARNVGLNHAVGKWIVFADADDFFMPDLEKAMDEYVDSDYDVIFFKGQAIKIPTGETSHRGDEFDRRVQLSIDMVDFSEVLMYSTSVKKFYNHSFVTKYQIRFHEVRWSNDVLFSAQVALYAQKLKSSALKIYCITESEGTLTTAPSLQSMQVRFEEAAQEIVLHHKRFGRNCSSNYWFFRSWYSVYRYSKWLALKDLPRAVWCGGWSFVQNLMKCFFRNV